MGTKIKQTAEHHQINRLLKQLRGHERIIADLQQALAGERAARWRVEVERDAGRHAFNLACEVAREILDRECRDSIVASCWIHQYPGILGEPKETTDEAVAAES